MSHWSDKYVGQPYVHQTGDCASLAVKVAKEVFGKSITLPEAHASTIRAQAAQILECKEEYATRIDEPQDGQPVLLVARGRSCHIGIMCWIQNEWWILHANQAYGFVTRERRRDMTWFFYKVEGYYSWI